MPEPGTPAGAAVLLVACCLLFPARAVAEPDVSKATRPEPLVPALVATPPTGARPENGYWSEGVPRWFVSSKSDMGGVYAKPYFSAGYGLPHWIWAGVDLNGLSTLEFAQGYTGVRASTPILDLSFGVRDTLSYQKVFMDPRPRFYAADVTGPSANARYWAWEGEVVGVVPLPHAAVLFDYSAIRLLDVPSGKVVYDESYRIIVAKPFFQAFRVAAVARLLREGALKIGVLAELLTSTGRGEDVFRLGPAFAIQLTDHLEALGTLSVAVSSPDSLGLALGAYGLGGVRYRWATGEPSPKMPWSGPMIQ